MKLALTTEYGFGPHELKDLMKKSESSRKCNGYSIMKSIDDKFNLNYYELTCWLPESAISGIKRFISSNPSKQINSIHAYAPLRSDFQIGNHPADYYNLSSCNEKKRLFAVKNLNKTIGLADELGAKYVVVHAGFKERNRSRSENLDSLLTSIEQSLNFIKENNLSVKIGVENGLYPSNIFVSSEEIRKISDFYPQSGLWLDVGHAFVNKSSNLDDIINSCQDLVIGFHLHNNNGKKDLHAPLKKGKINFDNVLSPFITSIKNDKIPIVLEIHNARFESSQGDIAESINLVNDIIYKN